jgi:hypothetical protein
MATATLNGQPVALGLAVPPFTAHAISVSLPTWSDNVGYEEGEKRVLEAMVSGYPRFFIHLSIAKVRPEGHSDLVPTTDLVCSLLEFVNKDLASAANAVYCVPRKMLQVTVALILWTNHRNAGLQFPSDSSNISFARRINKGVKPILLTGAWNVHDHHHRLAVSSFTSYYFPWKPFPLPNSFGNTLVWGYRVA